MKFVARVFVAVCFSSSFASSQPVAAPPYTPVRWNENYSYLKNASKRNDPFDSVKYISLGAEDAYLSLGGQARYRFEHFSNENFGAVENDWGYALQRYLLHADLHLGPNIRVFAQGKASLVDDGRDPVAPATAISPRGTDTDEIDFQQLFADVILPLSDRASTTLRFGRQDLIYGSQRLIGPLDWTNARRTFEGGKASFSIDRKHTIDAFLVRPVVVDKDELNDGDGDTTFGGVYATLAVPETCLEGGNKLEAYALGLWKHIKNAAGPDNDRDTYTLGLRFSGAPKPCDYDIELDYQFGQNGGNGEVGAYSLATEVGYTFAGCPKTLRLFVGFDYASGDDDPTDSDIETFNQLFPTGHLFFGYIDAIGRQNIVDLHPGVEVTLAQNKQYVQKLALRAEHHFFWRASEDDGLYNVAGGLSRADSGTDERSVGSESDLFINWQVDRHTAAYVGYSHFFAGDFISNTTGPDDDIDFFYAAVTLTF